MQGCSHNHRPTTWASQIVNHAVIPVSIAYALYGTFCCIPVHVESLQYPYISSIPRALARLAEKMKLILDSGMKCVYAIGEKLPEREKGLESTMAVTRLWFRRVNV